MSRIRSRFSFPRKTIPAKAGISQTWAASPPKRRRRWRQMKERFLPSQEWSCGGRGICGRIWRGNCGHILSLSPPPNYQIVARTVAKNPPHTPVHPQTIPAKAGISQSCAANGGVIKAAMPPMAMRFLPTQEWSVGGRGIVGGFCVLLSAAVAIYIYAAVGGIWL